MDDRRFDSVARQLASGSSRRQMIRAAAGSGLALLLARAGVDPVAAAKKKVRQRCRRKDECKANLDCRRSNSQNSCYGTTRKRCCVPVDKQRPCENGCDCCGVDVICNGGYCQSA